MTHDNLPPNLPRLSVRHYLWRRGYLAWKLDALQQHILKTIKDKEDASPICVFSSRQIGKSFGALVYAFEFAIQNPGVKVRFLSSTKTQVMDIVRDNMMPIIQDAPPDFIKPSRSDYRWILANGSEIRLGAMERQYVDANRGGHSHLVIYEEGGFISSEDYVYAIKSVIGPQLTRARQLTGKVGRELHISSPSEDEYHYLHEEILPQAEMLGTAFRYTIDDSPSITPEMRADCVKRSGGEHTDAFRREYLAQIIRSQSLMVVPEFDETIHVKDFPMPDFYNPLIAIDGGGIRDKTAILLCLWDYRNQKMLVWDERILSPNTATQEVVRSARSLEEMVTWTGEMPIRWADVPGQIMVDLLSQHDYLVKLPAKEDVKAAIAAVRTGIPGGEIVIHPRCKMLIGNLKRGRYNNQRTDFERTELYGHCDPLMALVYGYRMIDRHTNPIPAQRPQGDWQLQVKQETDGMEQLASAIWPGGKKRK